MAHLCITTMGSSPQLAATHTREIVRRSATYKPSICDDHDIQSLATKYGEPRYRKRAEELKEYARVLLVEEKDAGKSIELIETFERMDISYLLEEEIKGVMESVILGVRKEHDLHYTSLRFRILRQYGFMISQDEFVPFLDESGAFKSSLRYDIESMLSLYDASYLAMEEEVLLDNARDFAIKHLKEALITGDIDPQLRKLVERGLAHPYFWRMRRLEARWFIDWYERNEKKNMQLLQLAKLNYNIRQAEYQSYVKDVSRWWKERGLAKLLPFSRDRLPECYLWSLGQVSHPNYCHGTKWLAIVNQLLTSVDDVYDVYGTLEELELLTKAVESWNVEALEELPDYMKPCYLAVYNFVNEMGYTILKDQGLNVIPILKKLWVDVCKAYMQEAKWFHEGYTPTLAEYTNNAWVSIGAPVALSSAFFLMNFEITEERLLLVKNYDDIIRPTSLGVRLEDDLGTSWKEIARGDVPKAVQCYMYEKGVARDEATDHVKHLINETWKKMNAFLILGSFFPRHYVMATMDAQRIAHCFYSQLGDGFAFKRGKTLNIFKILVVEPIPMEDIN